MDEYVSFLGDAVLSDKKIITYRLLSRNLKVHVRQAKEMLFEFHKSQNLKNPDSIHATYLLSGYRRKPTSSSSVETEDEDTMMRSSPFDSLTQASVVTGQKVDELVRSIVVVPQEKLEEAKASFVRLLSVHVYSVQPAPLSDLTLVSVVSHELLTNFDYNDAVEHSHVYGTIPNPSSKRRSKVIVPEAPPTTAPTIVRVDKNKNPGTSWSKKVPEPRKELSQEVKKEEPTASAPSKSATPAAPARSQSGRQKFFSNWQSGTKKAQDKKADSKASSAAPTPPSQTEDSPIKMDTDSEGDGEEESVPVRDIAEDIRKRKAKQAKLEAMMMDDSDDELPPPKRKASPPPSAPDLEPTPTSTTHPSTTTLSRRRGRRKVQKTVHSRDEDGYLVTKQETVWESFSEDESGPPPPPKVKAAAPSAAGKLAKGKKAPAAQGNIMSFFHKK